MHNLKLPSNRNLQAQMTSLRNPTKRLERANTTSAHSLPENRKERALRFILQSPHYPDAKIRKRQFKDAWTRWRTKTTQLYQTHVKIQRRLNSWKTSRKVKSRKELLELHTAVYKTPTAPITPDERDWACPHFLRRAEGARFCLFCATFQPRKGHKRSTDQKGRNRTLCKARYHLFQRTCNTSVQI